MKKTLIGLVLVAPFLVAGTSSQAYGQAGEANPAIDIGGLACWIDPIHHCNDLNPDGSMTAHMGYMTECAGSGRTDLAASYNVPIGPHNYFPSPYENRGQPEDFPSGLHEYVFKVEISADEVLTLLEGGPSHNLFWHVTGQKAKIRPHILCDDVDDTP